MRQTNKPLRMKAQPHDYLKAILRRVKQLPQVHRASAQCYVRAGTEKAVLTVTYSDGDWGDPDPTLREAVDVLRREFSAAFPDWGFSVQWRKHSPVRIRPVVESVISGEYIVQTLDCGHSVQGERIRVKRCCPDCSDKVEE